MRWLRPTFFFGSCVSLLVAAACGDDDNTVRPRLDGGVDATVGDADVDGGGPLACGAMIPSTYDSPTYETNAAQELALRKAFDDFLKPFRDNETALTPDAGGTFTPLTKAQLETLYGAGTPSVKSVTTAYYQAKVAAWIAEYEAAAADGTYTPVDPPDTNDKGGSYGRWVFNGRGLDLKQAIEKGSYNAAFYNHAVSIITSGTPTVGTVDRLVAAFGAHPSFPNNQNAQQNKDVNAAGYAARRDSKDAANPGPYQKAKKALITAKAAITAGERCNADRDAALKAFLAEWEKSQLATVIYYFNDIITKLSGADPDYPAVLHAYGEAVGFIAGFKTIPQERRIVTDAQIDSLLQKSFAADGQPVEAYKLKTNPVAGASQLQQVINDIKAIYGFSDAEVESFKKNY